MIIFKTRDMTYVISTLSTRMCRSTSTFLFSTQKVWENHQQVWTCVNFLRDANKNPFSGARTEIFAIRISSSPVYLLKLQKGYLRPKLFERMKRGNINIASFAEKSQRQGLPGFPVWLLQAIPTLRPAGCAIGLGSGERRMSCLQGNSSQMKNK